MKTYEEMTEAVLAVGEARRARRLRRLRTAISLGGAALLLAAFAAIGRLAQQPDAPKRTSVPGAAQSAAAPAGETGRETALTGPADAVAETTQPLTEQEPATAQRQQTEQTATSAAPAVQPGAPTTAAAVPTSSEEPQPTLPRGDGAASVSAEGMRLAAAENRLAWLRIDGVLYVQDTFAGTYENGVPKSPGDRLGAASDFEGNFGVFGVSGGVYTLRGRKDRAEILVITESSGQVYLIAVPE